MVKTTRVTTALLLLAVILATSTAFLAGRVAAAPPAIPTGTNITFQGFLQENGVPVTGIRTFNVQLFDAISGGSQSGPTVTTDAQVTNGYYVIYPDFTAAPWTTGERRYLQVTVNGQPLSPRTPMLPAGQAIYAVQAGDAATLGGTAATNFARLYGNGGAGPLNSSTSQSLEIAAGSGVSSFTDINITGGILTIPSGTLIRCTGSFTLASTATISVQASPGSGGVTANPATIITVRQGAAGIGLPPGPPDHGNFASAPINAGGGGIGLSEARARYLRDIGPFGGAPSPAIAVRGTIFPAVAGGGAVGIRCAGPVSIAGTVIANGGSGWGGAGGGVVLVGSGQSITVQPTGLIEARGGSGGNAGSRRGAAGGGGGGLVHLVAPTVTQSGTIDVSGGDGASAGTATSDYVVGGVGGGGSCGNGGSGGSVAQTTGAATAGAAGTIGCALITQVNPADFW